MSSEDTMGMEENASSSYPGPRRQSDRRTPRFSWNTAYEATFFRSLCESMQMGFKDSHSFKSGAWERAAIALRDTHGAYPEKSHLINKADNARKKFRMWRGLREDPDFLYNATTRTVTANEEAWLRHFEKEPLSKALRGRPFDHEDYMEILFPDVVGSRGAPKRIMKKRKQAEGTPAATSDTAPGQGMVDLAVEAQQSPSVISTSTQENVMSMSQSLSNMEASLHHASLSTASMASQPLMHSALTPPEEQSSSSAANSRKGYGPGPSSEAAYAEKRRGRPSRFSSNIYANPPSQQSSTAPTTSLSFAPIASAATLQRSHALHPSFDPVPVLEEVLQALAEALRQRNPAKYAEQAIEILFRDFADEDPELQLKIAEKALTDENKALVFIKSSAELRRHWVGRLRDAHLRSMGGVSGIGGRPGEEAT